MNKSKKNNVLELDKNMEIGKALQMPLKWLSPMEEPFQITGFPWISEDKKYRRMPLKSAYKLPENVDALADCTAGGQIRFRSNSSKLAIRVRLAASANMYHMPATGQCGFDCYLGEPGRQLYFSTTNYNHMEKEYECLMYDFNKTGMLMVTLNFPLYQGVEEVLIGVEETADILAPLPLISDKRLVFYGTSITQGGCAARPGMAYTNIISRRLNQECVNLGFSGNGRGEPEVARIISEIESPACFVLDYEANSTDNGLLEKTLSEFIQILRSKHEQVPILVLSKIAFAKESFIKEDQLRRLELCEFQAGTVKKLRDEGDKNIYFHDGSCFLGEYSQECTVDGVHPTDLGFMLFADALTPILKKII